MVRELDDTSSLLTTFTYILCQVAHMSREHIVGCVHRHGQQNAVFAMLMGLAKQLGSQIFGDIDVYVVFTSRSDA